MQTVLLEKTAIELKGSSFTLPVIHINTDELDIIRCAIQEKINLTPKLLENAPIVINVSQLNSLDKMAAICDIFKESGLHIVGISGISSSKTLTEQIKAINLPLLNEGKKLAQRSTQNNIEPLYIDTPIRSGQQVIGVNRDVIIANLVNAGAEIIADGNIFIYGELRGKALAGASGNKKAQIYCECLEAELISIAGQYWLNENIPIEHQGKGVRILLNNQNLSIHELHYKGTR